MKRKAVLGVMLILLLTSVFTAAFNIPLGSASVNVHKGSNDHAIRQVTHGEDPSLSMSPHEKSWDFNRVSEWGNFAKVDNDSMEMIIGISWAKPNSYEQLRQLIIENQGELLNTVSMNGEIIAAVADISVAAAPSFAEKVRTSGLSRYIEPNLRFKAQFVPNDPYWSLQWGPRKIEADYAWNTTTGNSSILVAVIDTGIDYTHPDLAANHVALGYDWVNDDEDPMDDEGHGTHCAGIIAAVLNNTIGIAGIANVSVMAEKGLDADGWGSEDDLANAIIHAVDQGADILSNSWGGYGESLLIHDAVQYAYNHSVLVIAAAGNIPRSYKSYPAAYDEVVAVTATDSDDSPARFTTFGDWVEVAAPGVNIYSTLPGNSYGSESGTSMACPHAAGVAALIWSQFPNATRDWVRARLRYTADDLGDIGFDEYYGYGRINARKAVEQAPPDHDLLIFNWEKPAYIQPGDLVSFNVTVLNFGINDEQDVTVQLNVDGNLTDSAIINYLPNGTSTTASLSWNPLVERTYNVTLFVVPVPEETEAENNIIMELISVRTVVGFVLFDQTRCTLEGLIMFYSVWLANLTSRGYVVDPYFTGTITPDTLAAYDIYVIPQPKYDYSPDEISAIQDFVLDGGGLLVMGDYNHSICTNLTSFAGITWSDAYYGWQGDTRNITAHDVTEGVTIVRFSSPDAQLFVSSPAVGLIRDGWRRNEVMLAVSEVGAGRVIGLVDPGSLHDLGDILSRDNLRLANNIIDWLLVVHDVAVLNVTPSKTVVGKGYPVFINVTAANQGDYTETFDVTVYANETSVALQTITIESSASTTITFTWNTTGIAKGNYTISAYATPVPGETETEDNAFIEGTVVVATPGDVNADGIVDILDAAGISAHWYPGPPIGPLGYDPNFDTNSDGEINILDAAIVSAYWSGPPKGPLDP